jgi:hypothetical protein
MYPVPKDLYRSASLWQRAALDYTQMCVFASQVIWQRSAEMALGTMSAREATRMILEKPAAFAQASQKAALAGVSGKGAAGVAAAAIRPIRSKTRANAKRLAAKRS